MRRCLATCAQAAHLALTSCSSSAQQAGAAAGLQAAQALHAGHCAAASSSTQGRTPAAQPQACQHAQYHAAAEANHQPQQLSPAEQPGSITLPEQLQHAAAAGRTSIASSAGSAAQAQEAAAFSSMPEQEVFQLSSFKQQYAATLHALHHLGHTKDMSHLARLFDPTAVLAAPDKGAAMLEALMSGAASLGDLALLRQLLRCMSAAQLPLTASGHVAVLRSLAQADRPQEALAWLQQRVPAHALTPRMVRALVQPLLQHGRVAQAERALEWAASRLAAAQAQAQAAPDDADDAAAAAAAAEDAAADSEATEAIDADDGDALLFADNAQVLPCMRLMVAAAKRSFVAVQQAWAAVQQAQQGQALGVSVLATYVVALHKVHKQSPELAAQLMKPAVQQLADAYHATAWRCWLARQGRRRRRGSDAQQWQQQQAAAASAAALWQQLQPQLRQLAWSEFDPALVLPQEVASAAAHADRRLMRRAFDVAMQLAGGQQDAAWMDLLLRQVALLKWSPYSYSYTALLNMRLWQGATPEHIEELLSELLGWSVRPGLPHYEVLAEAYALHRDLPSAEAVLDRIVAAGHIPLLRTYNRLLQGAALNGGLAAAGRIYARLKAQGLAPDEQTMRALFLCVRRYASLVRVETARSMVQHKPGDREAASALLVKRSALFAAAYSQLAAWQGELVAAGLKHTPASLHQLLAALERLGAAGDCIQLAQLQEQHQPGNFTAHRFALQAAGRRRDVDAAGQVAALAARVRAGDALSRQDYLMLIASQFWLNQDHGQLLSTVAAMKAAGHELDSSVLLQLLHVYCHNGMWGEAMQVLDDVASGRVGISGSLLGGDSVDEPDAEDSGSSSIGGKGARSKRAGGGARHRRPAAAAVGAHVQHPVKQDALWHVVMRKLWEQRASDGLLNQFVGRMPPEQLQRFKLLYNLQPAPDGSGGFTMQPLDEWVKDDGAAQAPPPLLRAAGAGVEPPAARLAVAAEAGAEAEG